MLPEGVPPLTLGWGVLQWVSSNLAQPDGDRAGEPFMLTNEQARFVAWFYAVDSHGRYAYRRGVLSRVKGWGKSPLLAALCCTELAGPTVFDGFDAAGEPVGRPHPSPWVQLAAVSEDQTDNTMRLVVDMLQMGDADIPGLDIGITRVNTASGVLQPVTAESRSREGQRTTFAVLDETHLWLKGNGGVRLAATVRRNLAKMNGRSVETTNAFRPGEDSVAEASAAYHAAITEGRVREAGLLYDHRAAPADTKLTDERSLRRGLRYAYGDAKWVDIDRIVAEVYDPATDPADARRFYLNQFTAADDAWLLPTEWEPLADASAVVADQTPVTLGFDGSIRDDATALIGCVVESGHLFTLGVWERPEGVDDWQVPREEVDAAVAAAMERYRVVKFFADPPHWQDYLDRWRAEFGAEVVKEWWTNRSRAMVATLERFHTAVTSAELTHDGDSRLSRHVLNARRRVSRSGLTIGKETPSSSRKIDAAMAAVLAYEARNDAFAAGLHIVKRRTGRVAGF